MKKYELTYIIHPDLEGSTAKITEKIKNKVVAVDGKVLNEDSWGKKKLAYEIRKNAFGIYEFLVIELEPKDLKEVERTLRLSEEILRSMVVIVEDEKEVRAPEKKVTKKVKEVSVKKEKAQEPPKEKEEKVKEKKKTKAEEAKEEKERQKELDEKLQAIIGPDKES